MICKLICKIRNISYYRQNYVFYFEMLSVTILAEHSLNEDTIDYFAYSFTKFIRKLANYRETINNTNFILRLHTFFY